MIFYFGADGRIDFGRQGLRIAFEPELKCIKSVFETVRMIGGMMHVDASSAVAHF